MSWSQEEFADFRQEALELLESAETSLMAMSENVGDFRSAYDSAFRAFHSLKGAAGMMELTEIQAEAHRLESLFIKFKTESGIPADQISVFLTGIDNMRSLLDGKSLKNPGADVATQPSQSEAPLKSHPPEVLREFIDECTEQINRLSKTFDSGPASGVATKIDEIYRDIHSIKGSAFLLSFKEVGALAHAMESSLEDVRSQKKTITTEHLDALLKSVGVLEDGLRSILADGTDTRLSADVRKCCDRLSECSQSQATSRETNTALDLAPTVSHDAGQGASVRVPISLLDNLMVLMGEMVLVRNQVLQFSSSSENPTLLSMSKRLNVVTSEIQAEMMKTRMQPIGNVISKFSRVVRDISQDLGKDIRLQLSGTETELDKSLLETVKDPLTHIVRNSCDHGIEVPEVRRQSNKTPFGTIAIKAFHEGGQVVVEISDDGRGLNREKLIGKALENGLMTAAAAERMTDKEAFNLIFAPGLSTAAKVTNISGRGVGMDVVRTNVEKLGGTVDVSSVPGCGTTIKLKIPLTLAIVPALIVRCGKSQFAIPQVKLEELLRVENHDVSHRIEMLHGVPVYRLRGNVLPLVDMNNILGLETQRQTYTDRIVNIAVLSAERSSFGVIIDEVKDTADIVVKPLNRLLKSLQIYSGATILGDGSVALIFDVAGISRVAQIGKGKGGDTGEKLNQSLGTKDSHTREYLLVEVNDSTKHALPLESVHRLEDVNSDRFEWSGFQKVIRYGEKILPIVNVATSVGYESANKSPAISSVVVVKHDGEMYGLEVRKILDTLSTNSSPTPLPSPTIGLASNLNLNDGLVVVLNVAELVKRPELLGVQANGRSANLMGRAA